MFESLSTALRTFLSKFRLSNGREDSSKGARRSRKRVGLIERSTPSDIRFLLEDGLRPQDLAELEALGRDPKTSLTEGFALSDPHCYTILVEGRPAAMFGVVPTDDPDVGIVWMLGTNRLLKGKRELVVEARHWLQYLNSVYHVLTNAVDSRNSVSIAWLEVLGFTFGPDLILPSGAVFRSFSRCVTR